MLIQLALVYLLGCPSPETPDVPLTLECPAIDGLQACSEVGTTMEGIPFQGGPLMFTFNSMCAVESISLDEACAVYFPWSEGCPTLPLTTEFGWGEGGEISWEGRDLVRYFYVAGSIDQGDNPPDVVLWDAFFDQSTGELELLWIELHPDAPICCGDTAPIFHLLWGDPTLMECAST